MEDEISFLACIAETVSAIRIDGSGGGGRVILELPENQMMSLLKLTPFRKTLLRVTVVAIDEE